MIETRSRSRFRFRSRALSLSLSLYLISLYKLSPNFIFLINHDKKYATLLLLNIFNLSLLVIYCILLYLIASSRVDIITTRNSFFILELFSGIADTMH